MQNPFQRAMASSEMENAPTRREEPLPFAPTLVAPTPESPPVSLVQTCLGKVNTLVDVWHAQYAKIATDDANITDDMRQQIRTLHQLRMLYMEEWKRVLARASNP